MIAITKIHVKNAYDDDKSRRMITFIEIFSILNFTYKTSKRFLCMHRNSGLAVVVMMMMMLLLLIKVIKVIKVNRQQEECCEGYR